MKFLSFFGLIYSGVAIRMDPHDSEQFQAAQAFANGLAKLMNPQPADIKDAYDHAFPGGMNEKEFEDFCRIVVPSPFIPDVAIKTAGIFFRF